MSNLFYYIFQKIQHNKVLSLVIGLLFIGVCAYQSSQLQFDEDITRIIPKNQKNDVTTKALKQLNFSDKITVIFEKNDGGNLDDMTELADQFVSAVTSDSLEIESVQGIIDDAAIAQTMDFVYDNLPLFLSTADYQQLEERLSSDSIKAQTEANFKSILSPSGLVTSTFIQKDPLGISFTALKKLQKNTSGADFFIHNGFITSADSTQVLLFINPKYGGTDTAHNSDLVARLSDIQQQLNTQYNTAKLSYFGAPFIAVANADQIKTDITSTIIASMGILMLLLVVFYKKIYVPLLVFIPSVFGGLFALAFLSLIKTSISAISLSIGAVLIGITIDYSLHILTHYKSSSNPKILFKEITKPLLMSASTTAIAFLCLLFVHAEALIDLGIFASVCIMSSAIATLIIIPQLYQPKGVLETNNLMDKIAGFAFEKNKILWTLCILLLIVSCFTFQKVKFNNNLSDLNYVPQVFKEAEEKLNKSTHATAKSLYVVAHGNTLDEALKHQKELIRFLEDSKTHGEILQFTALSEFVLNKTQQVEKFQEWNSFWSKHNTVKSNLQNAGAVYGFTPQTHQPFYDLLDFDFQPLSMEDYSSVQALSLRDFIASTPNFYTVSTLVKLDESKRMEFMTSIKGLDNVLVIDRKGLNETYLGKLKDDFNNLINYSFIAVLLILWVFFRRLELVLLSAIPIALTGLVTAGLMGIFGLELNIFSAIVCTLIFGHGVDFSIFMTAALQKQYSDGVDEVKTYRTSIILAVLTTILAIGALVFAKHPALRSISTVSLVGVFAAVLITFVFYPLLFRVCIVKRSEKGKSPLHLGLTLESIVFFIIYGVLTLLCSIVGRFILYVLPFSKKKKQDLFSVAMQRYMKISLWIHPRIKHQIENTTGENFNKPAVIIANHNSFLDILMIGILNPRIIFLVNDWVWNSPLFGRVIQAAGFYPVSQGLDSGLTALREKVAMGYSLMVFPEGTRSKTDLINRFHKGAFFLAQELELDIVPVYLHGNAHVLPKGDYQIYGGVLTTLVGQRMPNQKEANYAQVAKLWSTSFKVDFAKYRTTLEGPDYFNKRLIHEFRYKEAEVYDAVVQQLQKHAGDYHIINQELNNSIYIVHINSSYGVLDLLLSWQNRKRKITSIHTREISLQTAMALPQIQTHLINFKGGFDDLTRMENTVMIINDDAVDHHAVVHLAALVDCVYYIGDFTGVSKDNKAVLSSTELSTTLFKLVLKNGI